MPASTGLTVSSLHARVAAYERWAKEPNRRTATQKARDAKWRRYLEKVDPDGTLPEAERIRRAEALRRADMARMALQSVRVRQWRKEAAQRESLRARNLAKKYAKGAEARLAELERDRGDAA